MENYWLIIINLIIFVAAVFFLVKTSEMVTDSLEKIADLGKINLLAITSFLGAIALCLPEFFISIFAAVEGNSDMVVGLLVGANIVNITIAVGMASLIGGEISVLDRFVKKDIGRTLLISLLPLILFLDKFLSRLDGIVLLIIYGIYYFVIFKENKSYEQSFDFDVDDKGFELAGKIFHRFEKKYKQKQMGWFGIGILGLIIAAELAVRSGELLAKDLTIPNSMIGLFFLAFGTSLPEIVLGIRSCKKKKSGIILGNLVGSLVSRLTLILGLVAIINPIELTDIDSSNFVAVGVYFFSFLCLWFFIKTRLRLVRWEGLVLTIIYIVFILTQF